MQKVLTSKQYFSSLRIIFLAIMAGAVMFPAVIYLSAMPANDPASLEEQDMTLLVAVTAGFTGMVILSFMIRQILTGKAREEKDLPKKALKYRSALIIQYALLETASIGMGVISMLLMTGELLLLCVIPVVLLFLNRPSAVRMAQQLHLTAQEAVQLTQPDFVISYITYTNN